MYTSVHVTPTYLGKQLMPSLFPSLKPSLVSLLSCPHLYNILNIYTMTYTHIQYPTHLYKTCIILRSVLLSITVIVVQPVLIIEVGNHWRQGKGIKSHLTPGEGVMVKPQLFRAQIYPIKAVLRCKIFKSAAPTQFLRYNQNKNCSKTSIPL